MKYRSTAARIAQGTHTGVSCEPIAPRSIVAMNRSFHIDDLVAPR
jgi:hypothetical protein